MKLHVYSSCTLVVLITSVVMFKASLGYSAPTPIVVGMGSLSSQVAFTNKFQAQLPQVVLTKSYREWKASMISEAEQRVKATKENLNKSRTAASTVDPNLMNKPSGGLESGLNPNLQHIQELLEKEQLQLSMAQDLTISDYFVGYLTKQKSLPQAIKEVSGRLTAEEVAELMTAYANNFFSTRPTATQTAPSADSGL